MCALCPCLPEKSNTALDFVCFSMVCRDTNLKGFWGVEVSLYSLSQFIWEDMFIITTNIWTYVSHLSLQSKTVVLIITLVYNFFKKSSASDIECAIYYLFWCDNSNMKIICLHVLFVSACVCESPVMVWPSVQGDSIWLYQGDWP